MWDVFSKDVCFCQSHPKHVGINMISTLRFERRLLIPFRAKKDVFPDNGCHLKTGLFSERRLFFLKAFNKQYFGNFQKHDGHACNPHER